MNCKAEVLEKTAENIGEVVLDWSRAASSTVADCRGRMSRCRCSWVCGLLRASLQLQREVGGFGGENKA